MDTIRIGMIGLDTSHVVAFTKLLNDPAHQYHVPGGKVVVAFPGGSSDMELSYSRVEGFTHELRDHYDVKIVDSPEEVAEKCDAIFLESVDGRVHLKQFKKIVSYQKPVFIDKPFTTSSKEAKDILWLADENQTPIMSCSAVRFAVGLSSALKKLEGKTIIGMDCYGPLAIEAHHGLFWYGIHTADMLYRAFGTGCERVTVTKNADHDVLIGEWKDGRIGSLRGNRKGNNTFGAAIHSNEKTEFVNASSGDKPYYAALLEEIVQFLCTGISPVDINETVEITRFLEAANESRSTGKTVEL
ncbi:Gfo/Idh/MocA family oxidoreductase [Bacillaceae bacterium SIJ1]|uniref:Gfo/Idh/MocA family protein n=1 Tax=Litoribacterium kuwaitense TaxID=1398745 RepID=UPI0013EDF493|nr:Gfo/Idh/MocA family oxidoreductase [Litoribacterium kuwaitense]NGP45616.1 Gfo/Idh/MocA family oxidoreductase [Litoribacterium kuwaitense]